MQLDHKKILISVAIAISAVGLIYLAYMKYGSSSNNINKIDPNKLISIETFNQALERPEDNVILNSIVNANGGPLEYAKAVAPYDPITTNLTEGMARDLYVAAQYSSIDSVVNSPELMAAALDKSLHDYTKASAPRAIITSATMSLSDIRAYGNTVGAMLKFFSVSGPALLISADDIINQKDTARLGKLSEWAKKTDELCSSYASGVTAPLEVKSLHEKLIGECDTLSGIIIALSERDSDPLKLVVEIPKIEGIFGEIKSTAKNYNSYMNTKKIFYKTQEAGYNIGLNAI
jgi:hypothetical protein